MHVVYYIGGPLDLTKRVEDKYPERVVSYKNINFGEGRYSGDTTFSVEDFKTTSVIYELKKVGHDKETRMDIFVAVYYRTEY